MNALADDDWRTPGELRDLARRAVASPLWQWVPTRDLDKLAPLAQLNSRCRRAWLRGDADALSWLAEQHRHRADARRLDELVVALESAP